MADNRDSTKPQTLAAYIQANPGTKWIGKALFAPESRVELPTPRAVSGSSARRASPTFQFRDELAYAVRSALLLSQPLLLTGEPGVGKTQAAVNLAEALALKLWRFTTRSVTVAADLLYTIDDIGRFRDAQQGQKSQPLGSYIKLGPLAQAAILSLGPDQKVAFPAKKKKEEEAGAEAKQPEYVKFGAEGWKRLRENFGLDPEKFETPGEVEEGKLTLRHLFPKVFEEAENRAERRRSVVLVDEIDKAPRDTPNDLLIEFEEMRLVIRELDLTLKASPEYWPIIILTTNNERSLPEPLLRRCVFHTLTYDPAQLAKILDEHLKEFGGKLDIRDRIVEVFRELRGSRGVSGQRSPLALSRAPSNAEAIAAARVMASWHTDGSVTDPVDPQLVNAVAGTIAKTEDDRRKILNLLNRLWNGNSPAADLA